MAIHLIYKIGRTLVFGLFLCFMFSACNSGSKADTLEPAFMVGEAQGSTFSISYFTSLNANKQAMLKKGVDSVFTLMDDLFSHWIEASSINTLNNNKLLQLSGTKALHFKRILELSDSVYQFSNDLFDVSIYPLVKKWGFGKNMKDSSINYVEALAAVDFSKVKWLFKEGILQVNIDSNQALDFNSIAQGYTVDVLADLFETNGVKSYLIEVGGELRIGNKKPNGDLWGVGIDKPIENGTRELIDTIYAENAALVTSGSYRKFYEKNGKKYSHSINPKTGKPVVHNLLSITLLAKNKNCALADALATAVMVMGDDVAKQKFENLSDYQLLYIQSVNGEFVSQWQNKIE